jgi:hypothetical protein
MASKKRKSNAKTSRGGDHDGSIMDDDVKAPKLGYQAFQELTKLLGQPSEDDADQEEGRARIADGQAEGDDNVDDDLDEEESEHSHEENDDLYPDEDDLDEDVDDGDDDDVGQDAAEGNEGNEDDEAVNPAEDEGEGAGGNGAEDEDDDAGGQDEEEEGESTINAGVSLDLNVRALSNASFSTFLPVPHTIRIMSETAGLELGKPFPKGKCCMWDTYEVNDGRPTCQIILRRDDAHQLMETYGGFCSWECAMAKSESLDRDGNLRDARKQWILEMASHTRGSAHPVRCVVPAPDPAILEKYPGGIVPIEVYRLFGAAGVICRLVLPTQLQEYRFTNLAAMLSWAIDDKSANQTVATEKERKSLGAIAQRTLQTAYALKDYGQQRMQVKIPDQAIRDIMDRDRAVNTWFKEQAEQQQQLANAAAVDTPSGGTTTTQTNVRTTVADQADGPPRRIYPTTGTLVNKMGIEHPRGQTVLARATKVKGPKLKKGLPKNFGKTSNLADRAKKLQQQQSQQQQAETTDATE